MQKSTFNSKYIVWKVNEELKDISIVTRPPVKYSHFIVAICDIHFNKLTSNIRWRRHHIFHRRTRCSESNKESNEIDVRQINII